jgi:hypothetical protein
MKRIIAGRPNREGWEMIENGEAVHGCCFVSFESPDWRCSSCGHHWFDPTDPGRKEMDNLLRRILGKGKKERSMHV